MKVQDITLGRVPRTLFFQKEKLTENQLNHHVHIVGASGFGKTVLLSIIVKESICQNKGLLFIDLKNDLDTIDKFKKYAKDANREQDLQIFSLNHPDSIPYNLISEGTATQLKDKIMSALVWSEEYYKHQSSSFLLRLLIGLVFKRDVLHKTFGLGDVLKYARSVDALEELFIEISKIKTQQSQKTLIHIEDLIQFLKVKENFNSLQGLRSQLESLVFSDFGDLISGDASVSSPCPDGSRLFAPALNFFESIQQNKLIYIFLDSRRYSESSKAVGRFILQDLKMVSARIDAEIPKENRKNFVCIIDEFADLAQEDFIGFLDRARSSKMSVVIAHQELSDLKRISPEFSARLTGNTSTLYAFLQKNSESAEAIAGMAGTRKVWKETVQSSKFLFFDIPSGNKSLREVEEFNIHPNLIKSLSVGKCVCVKKYPKAASYLVKVAHNV